MTDYVVIDTDVFSFLFKRSAFGQQYLSYLVERTVCISFQTVAELYHWGEARCAKLEEWLHHYVILPYDNATARAWAHIKTVCDAQGRPISAQDAWIAACALRHNCPLVTHNRKDYEYIPQLQLISEVKG
jgi:tRNA(fMet)-specific endonuclease VapC